ncbi:CASP-like protein 4A3 [Juglans microcarpa x Juglans regia]|uniref:CASP-like protein 4A3 n=1 Tax=Juglans microcarpa x Juglans regia TaxID=2249226 RepID=UPI001B7F69D7|nr:CASP-like protein 4A3 [Juglans microcarpa x Juglans regia]
MEAHTQSPQQQYKATMKKSSSRNSDSSSRNMESPHSPLRFHSPQLSELGDLPETPPYVSPENFPDKPTEKSKAMVSFDRFTQYSPLPSPLGGQKQQQPENEGKNRSAQAADSPSPVMVFNRAMREEPPPSVSKVGPGSGRRSGTVASIPRTSKREEIEERAALVFRVSEIVLCLISFSVMAADKTQGWSGDSFDRYKEYRYCLSVNVIAFVYSGFQASDLTYHMFTGKHAIRHHLRRHFDFFMDQILAYLLISSSSSAATRVDDWQSNWGKDEFTEMASASVGMAFLAFAAFAFSSLISGYSLCTRQFT